MEQDAVNTQIIDAVCESDLEVVGHGPKLSQAYLDTLMAETTGLMMNQAVTSQQNAQTASIASLTAACAKILRVPASQSNAQVTEVARTAINPLNQGGTLRAEIQGNYSSAKAAINTLKHDLRKAKINRRNAGDFLDSLADLAKPTNTGNGPAH